MPNKENKNAVHDLKEKIAKAKSIVFADYLGLKADEINELRSQLAKQDTEVEVSKNTLLKIALREQGHDDESLDKDLKGPTAAFFSYSDAIAPIKTIVEFAKNLELPKVKSAFVEGKYNNAQQVEVLSTLPSKEQLLAQVVGGLKSPITGFYGVMSGVQRKFVYALNAVKEQKAGSTQ
jgi:large subunit ribosomal protein L10